MTIEEMKARKAELGYTNEAVSRLSGVPLGTVQKIFAGETKAPRYDTIQKLIKVLEAKPGQPEYDADGHRADISSTVNETVIPYGYDPQSGLIGKYGHHIDDHYMKPPRKTLGIADGKFRMPPDELLFDDEISEMFEEV